jgi:DNA-directed RNA polymerase subunit beta'
VGHAIPAGTGQRRYRDIAVGEKSELEELQAALGGNGAAGDGAVGDGAAGDGAAEAEDVDVEASES